MLGNAPVTVILPVLEMQRAREFYEHKLGLHPQGPGSDGMFLYTCGNGAVLGLSPRETGTKAEHTALSFEVKNIESTIAELERNGVEFADYDLPGLKTVNHVCVLGSEKAAWFNDPEGNILCLHEAVA